MEIEKSKQQSVSLINIFTGKTEQPFSSLRSIKEKEQKKPGPKIKFAWGIGDDLIILKKSTPYEKKLSHPSNQHLKEVLIKHMKFLIKSFYFSLSF